MKGHHYGYRMVSSSIYWKPLSLIYIYIYCKYIFGVDSHPLTLKLLDLMGHIR